MIRTQHSPVRMLMTTTMHVYMSLPVNEGRFVLKCHTRCTRRQRSWALSNAYSAVGADVGMTADTAADAHLWHAAA